MKLPILKIYIMVGVASQLKVGNYGVWYENPPELPDWLC